MCFTNYIGLYSDCLPSYPTPESGLYIDDLPGMNFKLAGDVTDNVFLVNANEYLDWKRGVAQRKVEADIALRAMQYLRMAPALVIDHVGEWNISGTAADDYTAGGATNVGIEICLNQTPHFRLARIHVREVEVLTNTTGGPYTLIFTDHLGNQAHSETFSTTAGQATVVAVDEEFDSSRIWVNYAPAGISYNNSMMKIKGCKGCGGNSGSFVDYGYARVRGREGANGSEVYSKNTYGLNVRFDVVCSMSELICRLKPLHVFKWIMLYATGIEIAKDAVYSDRFNAVTNLRANDFKELSEEWQEEYERLFSNFADNIAGVLSHFGDDCISCKRPRSISARL
jgi:hypothetical protein